MIFISPPWYLHNLRGLNVEVTIRVVIFVRIVVVVRKIVEVGEVHGASGTLICRPRRVSVWR
jgi:hypothetical protein